MSIIAKLSFWILKPIKKKSFIAKLSFRTQKIQPFEELIMNALAQFRSKGYVEKLKTSITSESLPSDEEDLLEFLFNEISTHS
jgi:hypothetical protein